MIKHKPVHKSEKKGSQENDYSVKGSKRLESSGIIGRENEKVLVNMLLAGKLLMKC